MASSYSYRVLQRSEEEGSNDSISNSGTPAESKVKDIDDIRGFTVSCPAVLEPSKDESRHYGGIGRPKNDTEEIVTRSCPQLSTHEVSIISNSESNGHEDEEQQINGGYQSRNEQVDETKVSCCVSFKDCYNNSARKMRNSWFVYIFQFVVSLQAAAAIVLGIVLLGSCEGPYPNGGQFFTILTGITSLFLIYRWIAKVRRESRGQRFWDRERDTLVIYIFLVLLFMTLELITYCLKLSSDNLQPKVEIKCSKTYFDSMYFMHIANAGSVVLAAFLYLPGCCSHVWKRQHLRPFAANGHCQPL